jgi:hypothetical protein
MPQVTSVATEAFSPAPEEAFLAALQDANMTAPNPTQSAAWTTPLFDPAIFDLRLGGDAALTGSDKIITVPFSKIIVTIGFPYGQDHRYVGDLFSADTEFWQSFTVWGNTGADLADFDARAKFMLDYRSHVFSAHGLTIQGQTVRNKKRPYDPVPGVVAADYAWHFRSYRGA